jgi:hypothetical protein
MHECSVTLKSLYIAAFSANGLLAVTPEQKDPLLRSAAAVSLLLVGPHLVLQLQLLI